LEKASWEDFTGRKNQTVIFDSIGSLIVPCFTQNSRDNANSRSSRFSFEINVLFFSKMFSKKIENSKKSQNFLN
jgi:hypothetical protein